MMYDELLREKVADWGYDCEENNHYEYTVFCSKDGNDGYMDECDETFDNKDEALNYRDEMIKNGWECRIKRYDTDYFNDEGIEIDE